ncbi:MAG TPA: hypothetical protein DDW49_06280, partial [Deltaproteobacteria bacterium]|nr:hypothetical protein [Deltaproteobacteria bacterium]
GRGDNADFDDDNDGVEDEQDACPLRPNDNIGDPCNGDEDADGFADGADNCPLVANANQSNFDGDGSGDACDEDVDGDGLANNVDFCAFTPAGNQANAQGCGPNQRICDSLADVRGHRFETEVCALVDAGLWPTQAGQTQFNPDEDVSWVDEIVTFLNVAGLGDEAAAFVGGPCPNNPYVSYAMAQRIVKFRQCPQDGWPQLMYSAIEEAERAFWKASEENVGIWKQITENYRGPFSDRERPFYIWRSYFAFAYERDALPDWNENLDPDTMNFTVQYGTQVVTKSQAAYLIYQIFEMGKEERIDLPEHVAYLNHARAMAGLDADYDVNGPMKKGELIGLGMRLMKLEGCIDYEDEVDNPFGNIADDYEYVAELAEAGRRGVIRNGEGDFRGAAGTWVFNTERTFNRLGEIIWLYRILRLGVACKQSCYTLWLNNRDQVNFSADDVLGNKYDLQATCAYVLDALPFTDELAGGLIDTHLDEIPEAEESLVTIYRMLQVGME